jgi:hypothetical protein
LPKFSRGNQDLTGPETQATNGQKLAAASTGTSGIGHPGVAEQSSRIDGARASAIKKSISRSTVKLPERLRIGVKTWGLLIAGNCACINPCEAATLDDGVGLRGLELLASGAGDRQRNAPGYFPNVR